MTVTAVIFPDRRLRSTRAMSLVGRLLQAGVIVEFFVESTEDDITDALTKLSAGDADTTANFLGEISTGLVESFDEISDDMVASIGVAAEAPATVTETVEKTAAPTPAPESSSAGVIIIFVIIVLGVLGAGVYFFMGKGGGS